MWVPVPHQGYYKFIERHPDVGKILIFDESIIDAMAKKKGQEYLNRSSIPAIESIYSAQTLRSMGIKSVSQYSGKLCTVSQERFSNDDSNKEFLVGLGTFDKIILPYEDVSFFFKEDYLKPLGLEEKVDMTDKAFLRHNGAIPQFEQVKPDREITSPSSFLVSVLEDGNEEAQHSSDHWRGVGAVLFDEENKKILFRGFNKHTPYEHLPNIYGDARASFVAGTSPDLITAIHAEQLIFSQALLEGQSTKGLSIYVTTYPCPVCAKIIANSGIKRVYYTQGYSVMEQAGSVLKAKNVEIVHVPYFVK